MYSLPMIVVRGTSGIALFVVSKKKGNNNRTVFFVNDLQTFTLRHSSLADYRADINAVFQHAISISGTVQQIAELDINP